MVDVGASPAPSPLPDCPTGNGAGGCGSIRGNAQVVEWKKAMAANSSLRIVTGPRRAARTYEAHRQVRRFVPPEREALRRLHREAPRPAADVPPQDKFVSIEGVSIIVDSAFILRNVPEATDRAACKALGVNWDDWCCGGLPVMTEDGTSLGMVGNHLQPHHRHGGHVRHRFGKHGQRGAGKAPFRPTS
ncbi:MAG: hypothetical protein ACLT98_08370 [Eggerthellaceae bacterium]